MLTYEISILIFSSLYYYVHYIHKDAEIHTYVDHVENLLQPVLHNSDT